MDMQALGNDLDKALRALPRPMVEKLFKVVGMFKEDLGTIFPKVFPILLPHVLAAVPEYTMEILDTDAIGATVSAVFVNYLAESEPETPVVLQAG